MHESDRANSSEEKKKTGRTWPDWYPALATFRNSDSLKATWQLMNPRIPNYHLKKCYDAGPALQAKAPLTIVQSLSCFRLKMWDEDLQKMISFP